AGRAPRAPVDIRSCADGRDTGGRSAATALPLLEPRAALARPAGVLASLGGGDPGRDAPTLRGRRAIRLCGDRPAWRGGAPLSRRDRPAHGVRAGLTILRCKRAPLARDDRVRRARRD